MEKVASIQAALAAGTYNVPASAVASKLVDACWAGSRRSEGFMGEFRGQPKSVETSVGLKAPIVEASRRWRAWIRGAWRSWRFRARR